MQERAEIRGRLLRTVFQNKATALIRCQKKVRRDATETMAIYSNPVVACCLKANEKLLANPEIELAFHYLPMGRRAGSIKSNCKAHAKFVVNK